MDDFYAVTFLSYTKHVAEEYELTPKQQARNFYSILWVFMIQIILIFLVLKTVVLDAKHFVIYTPSVDVYVARFLSGLLLHMELIEDIK